MVGRMGEAVDCQYGASDRATSGIGESFGNYTGCRLIIRRQPTCIGSGDRAIIRIGEAIVKGYTFILLICINISIYHLLLEHLSNAVGEY